MRWGTHGGEAQMRWGPFIAFQARGHYALAPGTQWGGPNASQGIPHALANAWGLPCDALQRMAGKPPRVGQRMGWRAQRAGGGARERDLLHQLPALVRAGVVHPLHARAYDGWGLERQAGNHDSLNGRWSRL